LKLIKLYFNKQPKPGSSEKATCPWRSLKNNNPLKPKIWMNIWKLEFRTKHLVYIYMIEKYGVTQDLDRDW
jgi:hypothetical protein